MIFRSLSTYLERRDSRSPQPCRAPFMNSWICTHKQVRTGHLCYMCLCAVGLQREVIIQARRGLQIKKPNGDWVEHTALAEADRAGVINAFTNAGQKLGPLQ